MCTLKFDYDWADTNIENDMWPFIPSSISEERKADFERVINFKYKDFCHRINISGGKIIVGYSTDGKDIMKYVLACPEDLFHEIQNAIGS